MMELIAEGKLKAPCDVHLKRIRELEGYLRRNRGRLKEWHMGENGLGAAWLDETDGGPGGKVREACD
ncbi:MAG TPA: hypothetical protein GXX40_03195 [Firmicutes bacterium]|nr:hypothetical protein [Bacillota bacterium]